MAPKPRGLKGSKRAATFVPDDDSEATAAPASIDPSNPERTVPLDEDSLSLDDIFELRLSSLKLLSPSSSPDQLEEGRSLLRGILHGLDALSRILSDPTTSNESTPEGRETHLKALGLREEDSQAKLYYLQGFALGEIGANLPPPTTNAVVGGSKRRKIDLKEPKDSKEWLEESIERLELAVTEFEKVEKSPVGWFARLDLARFLVERTRVALEKDDEQAGTESMEKLSTILSTLSTLELPSLTSDEQDLYGGLLPSLTKSLEIALSAIEKFPTPSSLSSISSILSIITKLPKEDIKKVDVQLLVADAKLARFVAEEEVVEDKYRPEEEENDEGENDEEEEDEEDVKDLPDEEDVRAVRTSGEEAIASLKNTISLLSASTSDTKSKTVAPALKAQYEKLEEALLTYSAMLRKDEKDTREEYEKSLEDCRKEGGLERDE